MTDTAKTKCQHGQFFDLNYCKECETLWAKIRERVRADLLTEVSRAICIAEGIPADRPRDAAEAWLLVARHECDLAERTEAATMLGVAARVGAVRAARLGRDWLHAQLLAVKFLEDSALGERPRAVITKMLGQIADELRRALPTIPVVAPVKASLR